MKFKYGVLGGTFDLLHIGHEKLLHRAFRDSDFVTIGITTDIFNQQNNKTIFENEQQRKENIDQFINKNDYQVRSNIIFISDIFGNTLNDDPLEVIFVTGDTLDNALIVNSERTKHGLKKLDIIIVPFIRDSQNQIISSSRIRNGEISKQGQIYKELLQKISDRQLDKDVRDQLKEPFGDLVSPDQYVSNSFKIVAVGDITTQKLISFKKRPDLAIIDFKTGRKKVFNNLSELGLTKNQPDYKVDNPPGTISKSLIETISTALQSASDHQVILVNGEEDLAVIPAVLLSSLGTHIFYGQPDVGTVLINVDTSIKDRLCKLLALN